MIKITKDFLLAVKELINHKREYVAYILFLVIATLVCTIVFELLAELTEELHENDALALDDYITNFIYKYRSEALTSLVIGITTLGGKWFYIILIPLVALGLHLRGKSWKHVLPAAIVLLSTFLINMAFKYIINRPRPNYDDHLVSVAEWSLSYPSGHSMVSIAFYGFLIYLSVTMIRLRWLKIILTVFLSLLILAIGFSRIYLGVHYPSDVLAGFAAGLIWLALCLTAMRTMILYRSRRDRKLNETD